MPTQQVEIIEKNYAYHNGETENSNVQKKFTHVPFFLSCLTLETCKSERFRNGGSIFIVNEWTSKEQLK